MFHKGFLKVAGVGDTISKAWKSHKALDQAGLGLLAVPVAYHGYKAVKEKKHGEAAMAATELGGLGLLSRAVAKSH